MHTALAGDLFADLISTRVDESKDDDIKQLQALAETCFNITRAAVAHYHRNKLRPAATLVTSAKSALNCRYRNAIRKMHCLPESEMRMSRW
jgi:hypothetical protein